MPAKGQVAALPIRRKAGTTEVLLITSRETRRWVIPKGWPMKRKRDYVAAAIEAYQEAGVRGRIHRHPMGAYVYEKKADGAAEAVRVMVYLLEVDAELSKWPEKEQRDREWITPAEAASRVDEAALAQILLRV